MILSYCITSSRRAIASLTIRLDAARTCDHEIDFGVYIPIQFSLLDSDSLLVPTSHLPDPCRSRVCVCSLCCAIRVCFDVFVYIDEMCSSRR